MEEIVYFFRHNQLAIVGLVCGVIFAFEIAKAWAHYDLESPRCCPGCGSQEFETAVSVRPMSSRTWGSTKVVPCLVVSCTKCGRVISENDL